MKLKIHPTLLFTLIIYLCCSYSYSQNLLETSEWTISKNLENNENEVIQAKNHLDNDTSVMILKTDRDHTETVWNSETVEIEGNKTYRFSIWILVKSKNSESKIDFALDFENNDLLSLKNEAIENPHFYKSETLSNGKWFLFTGFIHDSKTDKSKNSGRVYDGDTGKEVIELKDFKFDNKFEKLSIKIINRNLDESEVLITDPRIDLINDNEPSVNNLLGINSGTQLILSYDNSGNIKQKFYCDATGLATCFVPFENTIEGIKSINEVSDETLNEIQVFPNPTSGIINLRSKLGIKSISVYNMTGTAIYSKQLKNSNSVNLDLTNYSSGLYLIHSHFENGEFSTQKILRK